MASDFDRDIFPFPGKVKSSVWNHFGFYKDETGLLDKSKAICKICRRAVNYTGNTTNLRAHIVHHHKGDWGDDREFMLRMLPSASHQSMLPPLKPLGLQTMSHLVMSPNVTDGRNLGSVMKTFGEMGSGVSGSVEKLNYSGKDRLYQADAINMSLIEVIINDLIPIETLDSPSFMNLLRMCNGKREFLSPDQVTELLLQQYLDAKKNVASCLAKAESEYLKVEIWKTITATFMTVSVQILQENWKSYSFVVKTCQLEEGYTSKDINDILRKIIQDWNLSEDIIVLSDRSKEVGEATSMLNCLNISSLCVAIEMAAKTGLDQPMMISTIKHAKEIIQFFTLSSSRGAILLEKQNLLKLPKIHLPVGDTNCWTSVLEMLEVLHEQSATVVAAFNDPLLEILDTESKIKMLTSKEQTVIQGMMNMLKPMKMATTLIRDMKFPTISIILPVLRKLEIALSSNECDSQIMVEVKDKMLASLKENYSVKTNRVLLLISSLLDPRYKDLKFVDQFEQETAYELLKQAASEVVNLSNTSKELDTSKDDNFVDFGQGADCSIKIEIVDDHESSSSEDVVLFSEGSLQVEQSGSIGETPAKRRRRIAASSLQQTTSDPMNDWLADVVQETVSDKEDDCIAIEISRYKSELQILTTSSPLSWWKDRRKTYPILSQVAIKYIAAPAILSNRDEKKEKLYQRQRASVSPENIEMMVFLHANYTLLNSL